MKGIQNGIRGPWGRSVNFAIALVFGLFSGLAFAADYQVVDLGASSIHEQGRRPAAMEQPPVEE